MIYTNIKFTIIIAKQIYEEGNFDLERHCVYISHALLLNYSKEKEKKKGKKKTHTTHYTHKSFKKSKANYAS